MTNKKVIKIMDGERGVKAYRDDGDDGDYLHTCPYAEEIHGDHETLCNCDAEATRQCMMDI